jgi:hypothetical protein
VHTLNVFVICQVHGRPQRTGTAIKKIFMPLEKPVFPLSLSYFELSQIFIMSLKEICVKKNTTFYLLTLFCSRTFSNATNQQSVGTNKQLTLNENSA